MNYFKLRPFLYNNLWNDLDIFQSLACVFCGRGKCSSRSHARIDHVVSLVRAGISVQCVTGTTYTCNITSQRSKHGSCKKNKNKKQRTFMVYWIWICSESCSSWLVLFRHNGSVLLLTSQDTSTGSSPTLNQNRREEKDPTSSPSHLLPKFCFLDYPHSL